VGTRHRDRNARRGRAASSILSHASPWASRFLRSRTAAGRRTAAQIRGAELARIDPTESVH